MLSTIDLTQIMLTPLGEFVAEMTEVELGDFVDDVEKHVNGYQGDGIAA